MKVTFRNKKLKKCCSEADEAKKAYEKNAKKLMRRLMELRAADNLSHIPTTPPPRCHELTGKLKGTLSVDLEHPWRLLFTPTNEPVPRKKDGGLDWTQITEIEIFDIKDTH